jgi:hypothetical protein
MKKSREQDLAAALIESAVKLLDERTSWRTKCERSSDRG